MSAPATQGWYVYGIVPSDVEPDPEALGIGDPPAPLEVLASEQVAALVSRIELDRPIGTSADLMTHEEILDAAVTETPVLPMRFGAVMSSRDAVVSELLEPHEQEFAAALDELDGDVQYVVRGRYAESAIIREILDENPRAGALRDQLRDRPPEVTHDLQIELGEIINAAIEAKRAADTQALLDSVAETAELSSTRTPTHELDAAHVALLVKSARASEFEAALEKRAKAWDGRVQLRLLGPMAPYDFVVTART